MANDETVAQMALINLAGQLLGHRTDIKQIEAHTQLEQDKLLFQAEKDKRMEALELEKAKFTLNMQNLRIAEREYKVKQEEYRKRGLFLKNNDDTTKSFQELSDSHGNAESWSDMTEDSAKSLKHMEDSMANMRNEIDTLDNALGWIEEHGTYTGGSDPDRWDPEDYDANIEKVKAHLGISELSESIQSGLEKRRPGQDALDALNLSIDKKAIESKTTQEAKNTLGYKQDISTVQANREAIKHYPEYANLAGTLTSVFEEIQTYKTENNKTLLEAIEHVQGSQDTPIMDIIGTKAYTKAIAHAETAPDELILEVVEPISQLLQSWARFNENYPNASQGMKDSFFEKASKILGHDEYDGEKINQKTLERAGAKIHELIEAQPHILGFAKSTRNRYRSAVDKMIELGIDKDTIDRPLNNEDPVLNDLFEMINTLDGDYDGSEEDKKDSIYSMLKDDSDLRPYWPTVSKK